MVLTRIAPCYRVGIGVLTSLRCTRQSIHNFCYTPTISYHIPSVVGFIPSLGVLMPSSRSQALQSRHPTGLSSRLSLGPWTRDWWLKATNGMTDVYGPFMFNKDWANIGRCSPT
jgi:hypothetical protein